MFMEVTFLLIVIHHMVRAPLKQGIVTGITIHSSGGVIGGD